MSDYVKNYIGESKSAKNFAKEYMERRSKHRNALKSSQRRQEDDLLTPAQAINPNSNDVEVPSVGLSGRSGGDKSESKSAFGNGGGSGGGGGGKKRGKKDKGRSMADASHLLGFSVASSERVNAGELDLPQ